MRRFDDDHAVHSVGDVLADDRSHAVIDVYARVQSLKANGALVTRRYLGVH